MAVCANPGRMYMGTARQYMEKQRDCNTCRMAHRNQNVRTIAQCTCENHSEQEFEYEANQRLNCREDGCQPESMCMDLPLAKAYMNPQPYTGLVSCEIALSRGSAFNNLYDPWEKGKYC